MSDKVEKMFMQFVDAFTKNHREMTATLLNQQRESLLSAFDKKLAEKLTAVAELRELPELRKRISFLEEEVKCREFDVNMQKMIVQDKEMKINRLNADQEEMQKNFTKYQSEYKTALKEKEAVIANQSQQIKSLKEKYERDNAAASSYEKLKKKCIDAEYHRDIWHEKAKELEKLLHQRNNEAMRVEIELAKLEKKLEPDGEMRFVGEIEMTPELGNEIVGEIKKQLGNK